MRGLGITASLSNERDQTGGWQRVNSDVYARNARKLGRVTSPIHAHRRATQSTRAPCCVYACACVEWPARPGTLRPAERSQSPYINVYVSKQVAARARLIILEHGSR